MEWSDSLYIERREDGRNVLFVFLSLVFCVRSGSGALRPPAPFVAPLASSLRTHFRAVPPRTCCAAQQARRDERRCGNTVLPRGERAPRAKHPSCGGSPREGARSEVRAEQRLAAGGCKL